MASDPRIAIATLPLRRGSTGRECQALPPGPLARSSGPPRLQDECRPSKRPTFPAATAQANEWLAGVMARWFARGAKPKIPAAANAVIQIARRSKRVSGRFRPRNPVGILLRSRWVAARRAPGVARRAPRAQSRHGLGQFRDHEAVISFASPAGLRYTSFVAILPSLNV
jgi:hypothetical protein